MMEWIVSPIEGFVCLCDERLTGVDNILITCENVLGKRYVRQVKTYRGVVLDAYYGEKIVAWMPLPRPYED